MRNIKYIIIHCSATKASQHYSFEQCKQDHVQNRGFRDIGYHYYIERDGTYHAGRSINEVGAHCKGYNDCSIGICYEGGLDEAGQPADTRTAAQRKTMRTLVNILLYDFPYAKVVGHHDLNPNKSCPCFTVAMTL